MNTRTRSLLLVPLLGLALIAADLGLAQDAAVPPQQQPLHEWQQLDPPAADDVAALVGNGGGRQMAVSVMIVVHRNGDLFQIVRTLSPPSGFARRLNGRQEQGGQNAHTTQGDHAADD